MSYPKSISMRIWEPSHRVNFYMPSPEQGLRVLVAFGSAVTSDSSVATLLSPEDQAELLRLLDLARRAAAAESEIPVVEPPLTAGDGSDTFEG